MRLDCNAFVGAWPFHKIREKDFAALEAKHKRYGIEGGYVSSTEAIFYNDPLEADLDLAEELDGRRDYRQVITVNPLLPGTCLQVRRAIREIDVAGVRILPGFHGYTLHAPELEALCEILEEEKLPLFLTMRMEDMRVEYLMQSQEIYVWELAGFLERHTGFPVLLCNTRTRELSWVSRVIESQNNVFTDVSGFKEGLFNMERLHEAGYTDYMVYGSTSPLFCMKSSLLLVETAQMPGEVKEKIMSGRSFLDAVEERYRPKILRQARMSAV